MVPIAWGGLFRFTGSTFFRPGDGCLEGEADADQDLYEKGEADGYHDYGDDAVLLGSQEPRHDDDGEC